MSENALLQALQEAVPASKVYTDPNTLNVLARDALHPGRMPGWTVAEPLCVVRPEHTAEVAAVVRLASTHGVPVIPIGGGSGLMGGAASLVPGLVLDLRGLQEIHVRPADRMADVGDELGVLVGRKRTGDLVDLAVAREQRQRLPRLRAANRAILRSPRAEAEAYSAEASHLPGVCG